MIIVHCFKSGIWMFPPRIVVHAIDQSISGWLPKDADVGHSPTGQVVRSPTRCTAAPVENKLAAEPAASQ